MKPSTSQSLHPSPAPGRHGDTYPQDTGSQSGAARSFLPQAARETGFVGRYRYWEGRSGRRFLFTRIDRPAAGEYEGAVLLATLDGEVIWAGDTAELATADVLSVLPADTVWYLHLLASTRTRRREIVADLLPAPQLSLQLTGKAGEPATDLPRAA